MRFVRKREKIDIRIIFIAVIIGIIFVSPHIIIKLLLKEQLYNPFIMKGADGLTIDETAYASNIRDVYDGNLIAKNSQLLEHKDRPNQFDSFTFLFLGLFTHLTGSVKNTFIIADFIFPITIFLLLYYFIFKITSEKGISVLGSATLITMPNIFLYIPPFSISFLKELYLYIFNYFYGIRPLEFSRLPFPEFTFIVFLSAIIFLYLSINSNRRAYILLTGFFGGLLFYTYLFYWTFFFSGFGIFLLVLLYKRRYDVAKRLFIAGGISLALSLYYWYNLFLVRSLPNFIELSLRYGAEFGRNLNLIMTAKYMVFILIFYFLIKKKDIVFYFLLSFLIGGILCINLQIVTGYSIESWHWVRRVIELWIIIMITYLIVKILQSEYNYNLINKIIGCISKHKIRITYALIFLVLFYGAYTQFNFARNTYENFEIPSSTLASLEWLDKSTEKEEVVLALSMETNSLITIYAHNNDFLPYAGLTSVTDEEIKERLWTAYKIYNVSEDTIKAFLDADNMVIENYHKFEKTKKTAKENFEQAFWPYYFFLYEYYFNKLRLPDKATTPKKIYDSALKEGAFYIPEKTKKAMFHEFINFNASLLNLKYELDYLYIGPYEEKIMNINFEESPYLKKVYDKGNIRIYKVAK